jgi:vitellogenic carboxypeptidase-like protein
MLFKSCIILSLLISIFCTSYPEINNLTNNDPSFPFRGQMYSGYIVIDNSTQANLFYHLYAYNATTLNADAPVIVWLQGGPGCSSMIGDFYEFGPVFIGPSVNGSYTYVSNNNTWNKLAHLLFVDQLTGVGFSVANGLNVSSTPQAAQYFNYFLARFYQIYPQLADNPLYIFGESYGRKYVPYFTYHLLNNETFMSQINLTGMGLGDGWSDPISQVRTYSDFGYVSGVFDQNLRDTFNFLESSSVHNLMQGHLWDSTNIADYILDEFGLVGGNISTLDYRQYSDSGTSSEDFLNWLNSTAGQNLLEVYPFYDYSECNSQVSDNFYDDNMQSVAYVYPFIFSKIPVIFYNGQDDDNCDYEGVQNYLNNLNWTDVKTFRRSPRKVWTLSDGSIAGLFKATGNMTFVLVFKAGHMVPAYQPEAAYELVYNFLNGIPLDFYGKIDV